MLNVRVETLETIERALLEENDNDSQQTSRELIPLDYDIFIGLDINKKRWPLPAANTDTQAAHLVPAK